jgi:hypothetical protein
VVTLPFSLLLFCSKSAIFHFSLKKLLKHFASIEKGRTFALAFRKGAQKIDL